MVKRQAATAAARSQVVKMNWTGKVEICGGSPRASEVSWVLLQGPGEDCAHDPSAENDFFQEDTQQGIFSADVGDFIDEIRTSTNQYDDVLDPYDIETIEKRNSKEDSSKEDPLDNVYIDDSSDGEEFPHGGREEEDEDKDTTLDHDLEYDNDDY
ncbi:hypothetical protein D1007_40908 [Hordeum vulgare]|nr:hypothetical protein D1007_40908 [Hordeum vulgare]